MDEKKHRRLAQEFKRKRHLRTNNPFCRICGKFELWANFHSHHADLRRNSDDQIFICTDCHNEVHAMLNEYPPIPANVPKNRHRLIHVVRGQMAIAQLSLKKMGEIHEWLLNVIDLPPEPATDDDDAPNRTAAHAAIMADLEARFGLPDDDEE